MARSPYEVLGVPKSATDDEVVEDADFEVIEDDETAKA